MNVTRTYNANAVVDWVRGTGAKEIGLDIETSPKTKYAALKRVPPDPRLHKIVLAQVAVGDDVYVLTENFEGLRSILEDKSICKVIQNASFEKKHFLYNFGIVIRNVFDTLLAEAILEAGRKPDLKLDSLVLRYLGVHMNKRIRKQFIRGDSVTPEMIDYAAKDAWVMSPLKAAILQAVDEVGYTCYSRILKVEHALLEPVVDIEINGFGVDKSKWSEVNRIKIEELNVVRAELLAMLPVKIKRHTIYGGSTVDVNLNSTQDVLALLAESGLVLPDLKKETVKEALVKEDNPVLSKYLAYKKLQKSVSTYGVKFLAKINPKTGRIHQSVKQLEARTGRLAGSSPNLMNIPKESLYRECFCAPEGRKLVIFDYSQQELRILAEISGDKYLIEAFEKKEDVHAYTARILYKDNSIGKDDPRRDAAKSLNFGLVYGMGVKRLAKTLKCSVEEAQNMMNTHSKSFTGAFTWMQDTISFAKTHGYVETLLGRRRYLDTQIHDYEGQARNTPIQGTGADMTKLAMIGIKKIGLDLVNVVHDETIVECDDDRVDETIEQVHKAMLAAASVLVKNVPFAADGKANQVWNKK